MDRETRMLDGLIEKLKDFENILTKAKDKNIFVGCSLPKDKCRSYANMKNVLDSLVKKVTDGKNCDEDIAVTLSENNRVLNIQPSLQNIITSEEYITETKTLMSSTSDTDILHDHMLIFQDLLGDILYSVCQINNYHLKLPSGIPVKDLLKVKNQYICIWESLFSKCNKTDIPKNTQEDINPKEPERDMYELQKSLQLCLKEMSKVKLEIEHFFKVNLIELQFNESNELEVADKVSDEEEVKVQNIRQQKKLVDDKQDVHEELKTNFQFSFPNKKLYSDPSKIISMASKQTESEVKHINSSAFSQSKGPQQDWYNYESCGDFFNQTILCPTDFLFFDPATVFLQQKIKSPQEPSLPKIYSVDSIVDDTNGPEISCANSSTYNINTNSNQVKITEMKKEESIENISLKNNNENMEDLFRGYNELNTNDFQYTDQQRTIYSLLDLLKTNKIDEEENIFEANPLKIENSDTSYSNRERMTNKHNETLNEYKTEINYPTIQKPNIGLKYNIKNFKSKKSIVNIQNLKTDIKKNCDKNHKKQTLYQEVKREQPVNLLHFEENNVIYDKRSVIELFRSTEINHPTNSGSYSQETSSFCLWPVEAKYIHVSGDKRHRKCHSTSSDDNSLSLAKSFEKSFYALHLNKQYEHNQMYEGDLIVLDNLEETDKGQGSNYSLLNQSYVVFDANHCGVKGNKNEAKELNDNKPLQAQNNPVLPYQKEIMQKVKKNVGISNAMAVQFAECGNSFVVKKQNIQRDNLDFFNANRYNDNNWNSFISIYTSKIGASARINHHRMFGNFINSIGLEPLTDNHLFGNIHTLTSNGGPYRLFDINGYPLTDSAGNVLKDPYGKGIVSLDSTGIPKNNDKVFDAAGNSPEDINFDPTQKPKTNTIIIKLTDNFKRPLHLFDKYGRPLTDAYGKLLVNIHGRPLLRFDNFGRPNTDYRGGPLYTDDGVRWSYKTGDSLSQEQFSNEKVTTNINGNVQMNKSCDPIDSIKDGHSNSNEDSSGDKALNRNKKVTLGNRSSDIWDKVENVLQNLPKKKKTDLKTSQSSIIINNVLIPQASVEKELLNSVIYHNDTVQGIHKEFNIINTNNNRTGLTDKKSIENMIRATKPLLEHSKNCISGRLFMDSNQINNLTVSPANNNKEFINFKPIETNCVENDVGIFENQTNCLTKGIFMENGPYATIRYPFYNNYFSKNTCSKCLEHNKFSYQKPGYLLDNYMSNKMTCNHSRKQVEEDKDNLLSNNGLMTTSTCNPKNDVKNTRSYFTFRNHDYLNNLCNEILKHQIDHKVKSEKNLQFINKTEDWTETSFTRFTSSDESKYTTELPTITSASPITRKDPCGKSTQKGQRLEDSYDYKTYNSSKGLNTQNQPCFDEVKYTNSNFRQNESNKCKKGKSENHNKEQPRSSSTSSLEPSLCINVLNQEDTHYEIKVEEKITNPEIKKDKISNLDKKLSRHHTNKVKKNKESVALKMDKELQNVSRGEKYDQDVHCSKNHKEKQKDSPFRFPSDTQMKSTIAMKNSVEVKYIRECNDFFESSENSNDKNVSLKNHANKDDNQDKSRKYDDSYNENIKYFYPNECYSYPDLPNSKKEPEVKYHTVGRRYRNGIKKLQPPNKECNLVSFLGSPVKYVLNKIDNRLSSRQYNGNKINLLTKQIKKVSSKERNPKTNYAVNSLNQNKPRQVTKLKTLYNISKPEKKEITSEKTTSNEKSRKGSIIKPRGGGILALRSKSCIELLSEKNGFIMSYSGLENDSQTLNLGKALTPSGNDLRKSTSASYVSHRLGDNYQLQERKKYETNKNNPKNEQLPFKVNTTRIKTTNQYSENMTKVSKRKPDGKSPKPSLATTKVKAKNYGLFKKLEPKGKQKRGK